MKSKITKYELLCILDILNENDAYDAIREIWNDLAYGTHEKLIWKYRSKKNVYKWIKMELLNFKANIDRYIKYADKKLKKKNDEDDYQDIDLETFDEEIINIRKDSLSDDYDDDDENY